MFKGRALLVIDRIEGSRFRWDIKVHQQSINQDDPGDEVAEAFNCAEYDCASMPAAAYKMAIGDRITVLVHYEIHYSQSFEGEWGFELHYIRERVLKHQPYQENKYRKNFYKFWREDQKLLNR